LRQLQYNNTVSGNAFHLKPLLSDGEEVEVGVVDGEVDADEPRGSVDPD
jgi:hypothetical protein